MIYTIGHSTRSAEAFVALLAKHRVLHLVDVRTVPRSRTNPQFNRDTLPQTLAAAGIEYTHMAALGGLRKPAKDSSNAGWRNDSFRGYADYMQTHEFAAALDDLIRLASETTAAVMCAEAVHWRCHRSLIADALYVRGISVEHIGDSGAKPHTLTSFAKVDGVSLTYPKARTDSET